MEQGMPGSWRDKLTSREGWRRIARAFVMEWKMVWKEVLFGFTVAGFIAVFVPQWFWNMLFLRGGEDQASLSFLAVLENAAVAPVVAFFTFIGSMGNVPLPRCCGRGRSPSPGVMSFLGADLVGATVVRVHAKYYGWRYTAYLSLLLYVCMVAAGITVHYLFALVGAIPEQRPELREMVRFAVDHTLFLNLAFLALAAWLVWLQSGQAGGQGQAAAAHARG